MIVGTEPIIMEFPLRGEWVAPNTPGTKVPSHGTNKFGTRYAIDFIQVDWNRRGWPSYRSSLMKYLILGLSLDEYYCWGEPVYAPCDGRVVKVEDGYVEAKRTNIWRDMVKAFNNGKRFDPRTHNIQTVAGNYIIIECDKKVYAALVHLRTGSICIKEGQYISKGELIGMVGHSGNSYMPHLHFQLMDSTDIGTANGLPFTFEKYDVLKASGWQEVRHCIPESSDRLRFIK